MGLQRYPIDADSDTTMSEAPVPPLGFGFIPGFPHDDDQDVEFEDEFDPIFPLDRDPDQEDEFILEEQPAEGPVLPNGQLLDMPADHEPAPADLEPDIVPELVLALDPLPVHDPIHVDAPFIAPPVIDAPVIALPVVEVPLVAPSPDPMPVFVDRAPFATHIDPRYADTRKGWIEDEDDYPPGP
ncbi:hypothetical protein Hanom_Chr10g00890481 [Helianthus anomalus]